MKSKSKFIIALVLFGVIAIGAIAGIIAVVASFNANVDSNFKVSYTAQNVHATVSAGYVVSDEDSWEPSNLTYTPIKAGSAEQIEFDANDTAEEVEKTFDGLTLDIKKNEYVYFKYTFTHTGDETNSMKFLNIALTKNFTKFENLTMEYGVASSSEYLGINEGVNWATSINELTAVRDEDNVTNVYIRLYVTTKTKDAKLDGSLDWTLTGSDEYAYENAYITGYSLNEGIYNSLQSIVMPALAGPSYPDITITFDYLDADTESIVANATSIIPVYSDGSYGVNAYVVGTDIYVLSEYNIVVTDCHRMFDGFDTLTSITFNNLDTSKVTDMGYMFEGCTGLTSIDLSPLDTGNVTGMGYMFEGCSGLTSIDLTGLDTGNVTDMGYMFRYCSGLTSIDLTPLDTSNVTSMSNMFNNCRGLTSINLSTLNTSKVTRMYYMFYNCSSLTSINLTGLDTGNVTDMGSMFYNCSGLTSLDLTGFNMSSVTYTYQMFSNCSNLSTINLTNAKMGTTMFRMFYKCTGLTSIDLTGLDTSKLTSMGRMFSGCTNLVTIYADESFDTSKVTSSDYMFSNCTSLVGGNGTVYSSAYQNKTYARIDTAETPGYFTAKAA